MQEIIKKWLSLFDLSTVFLLKESATPVSLDIGLAYDVETALSINKEYPYGLFFTPNGWLWPKNKAGQPQQRKLSDTEDIVYSVYVDIDIRDTDFQNMKELENHIQEILSSTKLKVQYIMKSWWGFHLYVFVKEDERKLIWQKLKSKRIALQTSLASMFKWWDSNAHSYSKLMRLPFSNHRKTWAPQATKLYKVDWSTGNPIWVDVEKAEQVEIDGKLTVSYEWLTNFIRNTEEVQILEWDGTTVSDITTFQINNISIRDIIAKLEKYPRNHKGEEYVFKLRWDSIYFLIDNKAYFPDGYKINNDKNYVNNFTTDLHDILERPRWWTFPFLYHYFHRDLSKVDEFLKDNYEISLRKAESWQTYLSLTTEKWFIDFTDKGVIYSKFIYDQKSQKQNSVTTKIFESPIYVQWLIRTNYALHWESEDENIYYILKNTKTDNEITIEFTADRKQFNKKYWKKGLMFLWSEYDLLDFYMAINKAVDNQVLKEYKLLYLNGYYNDYYVVWDKIITKDCKIHTAKEVWLILKSPDIPFLQWQKEVLMKTFWEKLRKITSDRVSILSYLTYIVLMMWHKYRVDILEDYKQQVLVPGLFLSGISRCWKTTMLTTIKNWSNLTYEARKYSIKSTTLQPLKQAATDDFILHLEEFTGSIDNNKETILRDIINKAKSGRGMADGENVNYIFRSWLILDWERLPTSESVINRCITVPMFEEEKRGNEKLLWEFIWISFFKDFIASLYLIDKRDVLWVFKEAEAQLSEWGIKDRDLFIYSYLLCVNKLFHIFDDADVIKAAQDNINLHKIVDREQSVLSNFLSELILTYRVQCTKCPLDDHTEMLIVPFPAEYKTKSKVDIINITKRYDPYVKVTGNSLLIRYDPDDSNEEPKNKEIRQILELYRNYYKDDTLRLRKT